MVICFLPELNILREICVHTVMGLANKEARTCLSNIPSNIEGLVTVYSETKICIHHNMSQKHRSSLVYSCVEIDTLSNVISYSTNTLNSSFIV